jgi:hypothetical protein
MRRFAAVLCAVLLAPAIGAQTVTIDNAEDELLVFGLVSAAPVRSASEIRTAAAAGEIDLRYVPPNGALTGVSVSGSDALVGAFVAPGREEHPVVFTGRITEDYLTVSRAYTETDDEGRPLTVADGVVGRVLAAEPIVIDNDYTDWEPFAANAAFGPAVPPSEVLRTRAGSTAARDLDASLYWPKGGTDVERLKMVSSAGFAYLMIETRSEITRGASYSLYAFEGRERRQASYTIEIPITDGSSGFVFLWTPDRDTPRIVGEFTVEPFYLEARVDLSRVPAGVPVAAGGLSFDFASAFSGARVTEEFFYTTLYARDIVFRSPAGL